MKNDEKKIALKLINKYADSYSVLEEENKQLKAEIKDMKVNLKINKEIIQGFFQMGTNEEKSKFYNLKLKEEITNLNSKIEKLNREKEDIKNKVSYIFNKKMIFFYTYFLGYSNFVIFIKKLVIFLINNFLQWILVGKF